MKKNLNQPQENELQYLQLLSKTFPTIADASTEIINLQAILNLPKGTEHFLADIHGAYESFQHVLKNASGNIEEKSERAFRQPDPRYGAPRPLHSHLLSRAEARDGEARRGIHQRLVPHHHPPACHHLPRCVEQIHPFESQEIPAQGVLLHHPGASA